MTRYILESLESRRVYFVRTMGRDAVEVTNNAAAAKSFEFMSEALLYVAHLPSRWHVIPVSVEVPR